MTKPVAYLYNHAQAAHDDNATDEGWWFQCCPCPACDSGGVDEGPFPSPGLANDAARDHIGIHPIAEEAK